MNVKLGTLHTPKIVEVDTTVDRRDRPVLRVVYARIEDTEQVALRHYVLN